MDFASNTYLTKRLKDFEDDHPLLILFGLNPEYMTYFDKLLEDIDAISNLDKKIKQMQDRRIGKARFLSLSLLEISKL